jgi:DNA (cytosine-5)-methyltransferase 1
LTNFSFVDLFSGIGGFHLALAGGELDGHCVLACDIDDACRSVYMRNLGRQPSSSDMVMAGAIESLTSSADALKQIPDHDLLCAGFPCQPFSKSGAQLGLRDQTRGTAFFHIMEIVREKRPRYLLLENVRNLLGPRHTSTWQTIVASIRDAGYRTPQQPIVFSPHLLPPWLGGSPQLRERVFIVAERADVATRTYEKPLIGSDPVAGWGVRDWSVADILESDSGIQLEKYKLRAEETRWIEAWQEFCRMIPGPLPGFPIWVGDMTKQNSTEGLPSWKINFLRKNWAFYAENRSRIDAWIDRWNVLESFPASRQKFEWQAQDHERDLWRLLLHLRPSGIRVRPATYVPALVAINQTSIVGERRRRITPREAARLQGFPDWFDPHENDATAYRQFGNAVHVGVVRYIATALLNGAAAETPKAEQQLVGAAD